MKWFWTNFQLKKRGRELIQEVKDLKNELELAYISRDQLLESITSLRNSTHFFKDRVNSHWKYIEELQDERDSLRERLIKVDREKK